MILQHIIVSDHLGRCDNFFLTVPPSPLWSLLAPSLKVPLGFFFFQGGLPCGGGGAA